MAKPALPHLLIAAQAHPNHGNLQFNTGLAALGAEAWGQAVVYLDRARVLLPQDKAIRYQLGFAYEKAGQLARAGAQYREALALEPEWALPVSRLIGVILRAKDARAYAEAQQLAERRVQQTQRRDPSALYLLARVYQAQGKAASVRAVVEEALPLAQGARFEALRRALERLRSGERGSQP